MTATKLPFEDVMRAVRENSETLAVRIEPIRAQIRTRQIMSFDEGEEKAFMDAYWDDASGEADNASEPDRQGR